WSPGTECGHVVVHRVGRTHRDHVLGGRGRRDRIPRAALPLRIAGRKLDRDALAIYTRDDLVVVWRKESVITEDLIARLVTRQEAPRVLGQVDVVTLCGRIHFARGVIEVIGDELRARRNAAPLVGS